MKARWWLHMFLHIGCIMLLLMQAQWIQELHRSEVQHYQTALKVRRLFFQCSNLKYSCGGAISPASEELDQAYWNIIGPSPNW